VSAGTPRGVAVDGARSSSGGSSTSAEVRLGVPVVVRVPATSANLGPGFDSLGLALGLHDLVTVEAFAPAPGEPPVVVDVTGEGAGSVPDDEQHLVVASVLAGLAHAGARRQGLRVRCVNAVPHGRGLGSSAAAVVAGLVAARGLLAEPECLGDDEVLALATAAEGHPDNAAAALLGGLTVSWCAADGPHAARLEVDPRIVPVVCVPQARLATSAARTMLPASVPHRDAAFTAGRAALLVEALGRRPDLLFAATEDRLHQAQRAAAMPATAELVAALRADAAAAVVSGAGPAVLVLCPSGADATAVAQRVRQLTHRRDRRLGIWEVSTPDVDTSGALDLSVAAP
jgi:homoserine kinase